MNNGHASEDVAINKDGLLIKSNLEVQNGKVSKQYSKAHNESGEDSCGSN